MAAAKSGGVQAAAVLLCLVLLAASPRAALGNECRNECNNDCIGWPVICQLSCASACFGESGISTLSTTAVEQEPHKGPAQARAPAPAPAPQQGGVSVLRGLRPSAPN
ncbi:unnamed protein product [Urochloa humidicola]